MKTDIYLLNKATTSDSSLHASIALKDTKRMKAMVHGSILCYMSD